MSDNDMIMAEEIANLPCHDMAQDDFQQMWMDHWPRADEIGPGNRHSGITCLIVVVRHILGLFPQSERNEILRFADDAEQHQDVPENERGTLRAILMEDNKAAIEKITAIFPQETDQPMSFEALILSRPYWRSLWNHPRFSLYDPCTYSRHLEGPYRTSRRSYNPINCGGQPHFTWDGAESQTLGERIDEYFGHFEFKDSKNRTVYQTRTLANPHVVSLRYSSTNPNRHFYNDLSHFELPVMDVHHTVANIRYNAVIGVRLRDEQQSFDSVQLYHRVRFPTKNTHEPLGPPWSDDWQLEDGGEFMMFYVRSAPRPVLSSPLTGSSDSAGPMFPPESPSITERSLKRKRRGSANLDPGGNHQPSPSRLPPIQITISSDSSTTYSSTPTPSEHTRSELEPNMDDSDSTGKQRESELRWSSTPSPPMASIEEFGPESQSGRDHEAEDEHLSSDEGHMHWEQESEDDVGNHSAYHENEGQEHRDEQNLEPVGEQRARTALFPTLLISRAAELQHVSELYRFLQETDRSQALRATEDREFLLTRVTEDREFLLNVLRMSNDRESRAAPAAPAAPAAVQSWQRDMEERISSTITASMEALSNRMTASMQAWQERMELRIEEHISNAITASVQGVHAQEQRHQEQRRSQEQRHPQE
ncbi:hypothetical protein QR685DRAFT_513877 [Neurospora intermedia]|uniref:Uncharacterized protein n=1 Tax=Neurospora intermedia TaxID=5142 RepID=A0ABR3DTA5_NEUIN